MGGVDVEDVLCEAFVGGVWAEHEIGVRGDGGFGVKGKDRDAVDLGVGGGRKDGDVLRIVAVVELCDDIGVGDAHGKRCAAGEPVGGGEVVLSRGGDIFFGRRPTGKGT